MNDASIPTLLGTILLLSACGGIAAPASTAPPAQSPGSSKPAAGLQPVKMGVQGQFSEVGVYVALERGYFKDLGLDVQPVTITTVGQEMPLLATDQLNFGAGGGGDPAFFNAVLRGVDTKIVGPNTVAGPNGDVSAGIMVRKDLVNSGKYKSPADLKGLTVAIVSEHTLAEYVVAQALAKSGLTLNDVNLVTMPFPDTVPAFANKGIDAAFLVEPFVSAASASGSATLMFPSGDALPNGMPWATCSW
ncbi:MAG TPA: ABC transporter substrate-binding protein [Chloroflexota bacterium]